MNGKSANINNAAKQIYPAGHDIPLTEVLCVFDADQVRGMGWEESILGCFALAAVWHGACWLTSLASCCRHSGVTPFASLPNLINQPKHPHAPLPRYPTPTSS